MMYVMTYHVLPKPRKYSYVLLFYVRLLSWHVLAITFLKSFFIAEGPSFLNRRRVCGGGARQWRARVFISNVAKRTVPTSSGC